MLSLMSAPTPLTTEPELVYPDSDGRPMSDNTLQFQWIVTLQGNFDLHFADDPNVFVGGDLLWYPVQGQPTIRTAPDTLIAFGRPKGYRGSYMQWREDGIAPQVVWEVLSPGNRPGELQDKFEFYERHGVNEYYQYDPDAGVLRGWLRSGDKLVEIGNIATGWTSPRLGVRMEVKDGELQVFYPDGRRFLTFRELGLLAKEEHERAERERHQREAANQQAEAERRRAERLAERLRSLGIDPDAESPA